MREQLRLSREELAQLIHNNSKTIARWERGECKPPHLALVFMQSEMEKRAAGIEPNEFSFVDLFAGIGGMRLGFESAGGKCVFTSEWNKFSQQSYLANFPAERIYGDITTIQPSDVPPHDVLLAGFPCQPFSIAGVSKKNALGRPHGFECETQGTLFFDIEKLLRHHRPKAFLLENVKNLLSHDKGNTWRTIRRVLRDKLGYQIYPKVIDARRFVPQHRERIFIVGFRDEVGFSWDEDVELPPLESGPRLGSILHPENGSEQPELRFTDADGRVHPRYTLSDALWEYLKSYALKHRAKGNGFGFGLVGPDSVTRTLSARYYKDGSEILVQREGGNPRRLTPRECARLMGFDSNGRKWNIEVSDVQAYKQFGNSVAVPVVEAIAKAMRPYILGHREVRPREQLSLLTA